MGCKSPSAIPSPTCRAQPTHLITCAFKSSMELDTCTTKVDLSHLGISGGVCVDNRLIERIVGYPITARKDKNQRDICRCVESIDIGTYESCLNGCIYCYAIKGNYNTAKFNRQNDFLIKHRKLIGTQTLHFPFFNHCVLIHFSY